MLKILLIFLLVLPTFGDGWVAVEKGVSFTSRLESFLYKVFRAKAELKNGACDVYVDKSLVISGFIKRKNITLKIHPLNLDLKGKYEENNNLLLKNGDEIFAISHIDTGANMQINLFDSTKMVIREDAKGSLEISSNAKPFYELAIICAYLAK